MCVASILNAMISLFYDHFSTTPSAFLHTRPLHQISHKSFFANDSISALQISKYTIECLIGTQAWLKKEIKDHLKFQVVCSKSYSGL